MRKLILLLLAIPVWGQLPAQITLQGGVWPGSRAPTSWPIGTPNTQGYPIPDAAGITCTRGCAVGGKPNNIGVFTDPTGATGQVASQFYVMGMWESGNVAVLKVDVESQGSITPSTPDPIPVYLVKKSSTSDFPASSPLAVDNGTTITISTGTATFIVKKAHFNLFDDVQIGSTHLVASGSHGTNDGLILLGPAAPASSPVGACSSSTAGAQPGGSTFTTGLESGCGTTYLSNLDSASTASIEENGPVRTTISGIGSFVSSATACLHNGTGATPNCYMHYTVRMFFYRNQNYARIAITLHNADFPLTWPVVSATDANAAYKQYATLTAQITMNLAPGSRAISIASHTGTPSTVSLTGGSNDKAYLYQGYSNLYEWSDFTGANNCTTTNDSCTVSAIHRTGTPGTYGQDGYQINSNQTITGTASGTHSQYPGGWADESDSGDAGVEIGVDQLSAFWPKTLEFRTGGNVVQVGIDPIQAEWIGGGDQAYVMPYGGYKTSDLFFNFHTSALGSASDSFLRFQQHLLGRVPRAYFNSAVDTAGLKLPVILNPLIDPYFEDMYYKTLGMPNAAIPSSTPPGCFLRDVNSTSGNSELQRVFRFYSWSQGGQNQNDPGLADIRSWLGRGSSDCTGTAPGIMGSVPGRYFRSHFWYYYFLADYNMPHSDWPGGWRCATTNAGSPVNANSCPNLSTAPCPIGSVACSNLNNWGWINITSANGGQRDFPDNANSGAHDHAYGMFEYYLISGEEHIKDQLEQAMKDHYLNTQVIFNNAALSNDGNHPINTCGINHARGIGHWLKGHARESMFLSLINDPEKDTPSSAISLFGADNAFQYCVAPDAPFPGAGEGETQPGSCTAPWLTNSCIGGVSRTRGQIADVGSSSESQFPNWPASNPQARVSSTLFTNMELSGLWDYWQWTTHLRGRNWYAASPTGDPAGITQYAGDLPILDLMYGISKWATSDPWVSSGTASAQIDYVNSGQFANAIPDHLNSLDTSSTCSDHVSCTACSLWGDCGHNCSKVSTSTHGVQQPCIEADHSANFLGIATTTNTFNDLASVSMQKKFDMYLLRMDNKGSWAPEWGVDYLQVPLQFVFNHAPPTLTNPTAANAYTLDPNALSLQPVSSTVSACSGTGCTFTSSLLQAGSATGTGTITWTAPAGRGVVNGISYRLKYSSCDNTGGPCTPKAIVPTLGFHNNCLIGSSTTDCLLPAITNPSLTIGAAITVNLSDSTGGYEVDPAINMAWFAATNVPDPLGLNSTPVSNGASSYTFNMAAHTTYSFYLAAYQAASPAPLPIFTTTTTR